VNVAGSTHFASSTIASAEDLGRALLDAGALSARPLLRPEDVTAAAVLQAAIRRCCTAAGRGEPLAPRDVETINSFAGDEPVGVVLATDATLTRIAHDPARCALASIARDAIETIALHGRDLRVCQSDDCGAVFLDRSRGRRRRWCSMASCGNRRKAAAYRARRNYR